MTTRFRPPFVTAFLRFTTRASALAGLVVLVLLIAGPSLLPPGPAPSALLVALAASPSTLGLAVLAALVSGVIGIAWGGLATLTGGIEGARRLTFLPLPLAAAMAPLLFGGAEAALVFAAGLACAPAVAVPAYATLRDLARRDLVMSLRAAGLREDKLIVRHILPNAGGPLLSAAWTALSPALFTVVLSGLIGSGTSYLADTWGALLTARSATSALASALLLAAGLAALSAVGRGLAAAARVGEER